jgi:hypothetical protein
VEEQRITVKVLDDGMRATIRIAAGDAGTAADLDRALTRAKVRHGVDTDALAQIAQQLPDPAFTVTDRTIACGTYPTAGTDGYTTRVLEAMDHAGAVRADGSLDFRERRAIINVFCGQLLATHHPAESGTPGTTVTAAVIQPAPLASGRPVLGKGVAWQDQVHIHAGRDGVLLQVADPSSGSITDLDVSDLYTHDADVDYRSGNLHIEGTAHVKGSVQPNFCVSASGDVVIDGQLLHSSADAGVNLMVGGGITGHSTGGVRAGGDVRCHHASDTHVIAGSTMVFGDHAINSQLQAHHIRVLDGRGKLAGGTARAVHSIHVFEAGSGGGTQTLLSVGLPLDELVALARAQRNHERSRRSALKIDRLCTGDRRKGGKAGREATRLSRAVAEARRAVRTRSEELLDTAEIVITGRGHAGVDLHIGAHQHRLTQTVGPGRYVFARKLNSLARHRLQ